MEDHNGLCSCIYTSRKSASILLQIVCTIVSQQLAESRPKDSRSWFPPNNAFPRKREASDCTRVSCRLGPGTRGQLPKSGYLLNIRVNLNEGLHAALPPLLRVFIRGVRLLCLGYANVFIICEHPVILWPELIERLFFGHGGTTLYTDPHFYIQLKITYASHGKVFHPF